MKISTHFTWAALTIGCLLLVSVVSAQPKHIPYRKGDKWGYCDASKKILLPPTYDEAQLFGRKSVALVRRGNKWGLVNQKLQEKLPTSYTAIKSMHESKFFKVQQNNQWGLVNKEGQLLTGLDFMQIAESYHDLFFRVIKVSRGRTSTGLIDKKGNWVIPAKYDRIVPFEIKEHLTDDIVVSNIAGTGYVVVEKNGKQGLYNTSLKKKSIPLTYQKIALANYRKSLCIVSKLQQKKIRQGVYNFNEKVVIPTVYDSIQPTLHLLIVWQNGKAGGFDMTGKLVVKPQYDTIKQIDDAGTYVATKEGKHENLNVNIYDYQPTVIEIPDEETLYDYTSSQLAPCQQRNKWGFKMKKGGKIVIPCKYDQADRFENGLAQVWLNGKRGYISANGVEYFDN